MKDLSKPTIPKNKKELEAILAKANKEDKINGHDHQNYQENDHQIKPWFNTNKNYVGPLWLVEQWIQAYCLTLINGIAGAGKSTFLVNLLVSNALRRPLLFDNGPIGDGRPSLYVTYEVDTDDIMDKVLACGGDCSKIHVVNRKIDFNSDKGMDVIYNLIDNYDYFGVAIDPIAELIQSENNNKKTREQVNAILKRIRLSKAKKNKKGTALFGITHPGKIQGNKIRIYTSRGASETVNMSRSSFEATRKKGDNRRILFRGKVNRSEQDTHGGIDFKIGSKPMKDSKGNINNEGIIENAVYLDMSQSEILKLCDDGTIKDNNTKSPQEIIKQIIAEMEAENKELNTQVVTKISLARGVSTYYLKQKDKWSSVGYNSVGRGQGKEYRKVLIKI